MHVVDGVLEVDVVVEQDQVQARAGRHVGDLLGDAAPCEVFISIPPPTRSTEIAFAGISPWLFAAVSRQKPRSTTATSMPAPVYPARLERGAADQADRLGHELARAVDRNRHEREAQRADPRELGDPRQHLGRAGDAHARTGSAVYARAERAYARERKVVDREPERRLGDQAQLARPRARARGLRAHCLPRRGRIGQRARERGLHARRARLLRPGRARAQARNQCEQRMAEREGFEPPDACASAVFKTAAFDHSATSPLEPCELNPSGTIRFAEECARVA